MSNRATTDIAIIGAGPIGLALAVALAQRGVRSVVIERKAALDVHSRAIALFPRTLEIFRSIGVLDALVENGMRSSHLHLRRASDRSTLIDFAFNRYDAITQCDFVLAIPQDKTERVLLDHARSLDPITVLMGAAFERFEKDAEGVDVVYRDADGNPQQLRAAILVGADGAHSAVREQLGWQLEGKTYATRAVLADVEVSEDADTADGWLAEPDRSSLLMSIRYAPRTWRLIEQGAPADLDEAALERHARELTAVLFGADAWRRTIWASAYRKHERIAAQFRKGRVLLAGDAAHLNSPAGGQGLNSGIRDAHNLAWKLDAIVNSEGDAEALLASYDVEQRGSFHDAVVPLTDISEKVQTSPTWVRRMIFANLWLGRKLGVMEQAAAQHSMLFIDYGASPLLSGKADLVGQRLPDAQTTSGRLHDQIGHWGMLLVRDRDPVAPAAEVLAAKLDLSFVRLPTGLDEQGFSKVAALFVRPDHIIGLAVERDGQLAEATLLAAMGRIAASNSDEAATGMVPSEHGTRRRSQ